MTEATEGLLRWRPRWWRRLRNPEAIGKPAEQAAPETPARDRLKEAIALGVAMAEAEAIWQLREKARRVVADQPLPPIDGALEGEARILAELDALRDARRRATDKIERLVRQAAREAERRVSETAAKHGADKATANPCGSSELHNKSPESG